MENSRVQQDTKPYELFKLTTVFLSKQTMLPFLLHSAPKFVKAIMFSFRSPWLKIADFMQKTNGPSQQQI